MINIEQLKGTSVAMVTPFTYKGEIDFPALGNLIEYLIEGGMDYLVVLGTTAETATLTVEEQDAVAKFVYEKVAGRLPLVIGVGGNNTAQIIERITQSDSVCKYDALLIATPYYNKPNQEGLFQHYEAIVNAVNQPIILYNVPGRTGVNMNESTTLRLAEKYTRIIAIKEASGNLVQINRIINRKPSHFEVISGDDGLTLPMISIGAIGVISVLANALPCNMSYLVNRALKGDFLEAQAEQQKLFELMQAIFDEGNPTGIKYLMSQKKLLSNTLRLPLIPASLHLGKKINKLVEELS